MLMACGDRQKSCGLTAAIYAGHNSGHSEPFGGGKLHAFQWCAELNDNSGEISISIPSAFKGLSIIFLVIATKANANTMTAPTTNKKQSTRVKPHCMVCMCKQKVHGNGRFITADRSDEKSITGND